jgi:cell division protein FtsB
MNVNLGIWDKLMRAVLLLLSLVLSLATLLAVYFWYAPVVQENARLRKENLALDEKIAAEQQTARQLKTAVDSVQNDPRTVERLARERLGYAKTNETVIRFETPTKN